MGIQASGADLTLAILAGLRSYRLSPRPLSFRTEQADAFSSPFAPAKGWACGERPLRHPAHLARLNLSSLLTPPPLNSISLSVVGQIAFRCRVQLEKTARLPSLLD